MSAELNIYKAVTFTKNGVTTEFGSLVTPCSTVTLDGDTNQRSGGTLAAAETIVIWAWTSGKPDFAAVVIQSDGILDVGLKLDKPTSDDDSTALTTYVNYQTFQIESHGPCILTSDQGRVSLSATAKSTTSLTSSTEGKVYEISLRNNGGTDVDWEAVIFN
jgi:hypothetical protein